MQHYICLGECEGESTIPGVCQATQCSKHSEPLVACSCEDGHHTELRTTPSNTVES